MSLFLIKNGIIGKAEGSFRGDVLVEGEKIIEVNEFIECKEAVLIDAKGSYVIPGGVDPHTHVSLFSKGKSVSDGFEAATKAIVNGELPPPPISIVSGAFTDWALDIAKK